MLNKLKSFFLILIITSLFQVASQEIQFGENKKEPLTDGPYVFWKNSEVIVKYILNDNLKKKSFPAPNDDAIVFRLEGLDGEFEISRKEKFPEPLIYNSVNKIFALSDVHGQFERMVQILQNNGIIDADNNWSWQNGHLVILGDVFDRGPQVTECLWLIYKLEKQAEKANGKVHFTLGNHEVMVLQGDDRYVHDSYKEVAEQFKMTIPELYGVESEFGRWLRTRNTFIKINDILFCHAGISPELMNSDRSLAEINNLIQDNVDLPRNNIKAQEDLKLIFGSLGPFWYRGYFTDSESYNQISQKELWSILNEIEVSRIIVGHTTQDFINPFFRDRVIPIDAGIKYGDHGEGLLWQNGIFYRAKASGEQERVVF